MKSTSLGALATMVALACFSQSSMASVMAVSNFSNTPTGGSVNFGPNHNAKQAISFTTGNIATTLASVSYYSANANPGRSIISIYTSTASGPGTLIATMSTPASESPPAEVTVTGTASLAAGTSYFVVFDDPTSGDAQITADLSETAGDPSVVGSGWSIGDEIYYMDTSVQNPTWAKGTSGVVPRIEIGVVPEPSAMATLGLVLTAGLLHRRRRRDGIPT